jgi:hypothetical protein
MILIYYYSYYKSLVNKNILYLLIKFYRLLRLFYAFIIAIQHPRSTVTSLLLGWRFSLPGTPSHPLPIGHPNRNYCRITKIKIYEITRSWWCYMLSSNTFNTYSCVILFTAQTNFVSLHLPIAKIFLLL